MAFAAELPSRRLRWPTAALIVVAAGMGTAGCIVEAPQSRYWIENNSDIAIVVRQSTKVGYLSVSEVPAHQKVEVHGLVQSKSCGSGFEIVSKSDKKLRTLDKVCDGDTIAYP